MEGGLAVAIADAAARDRSPGGRDASQGMRCWLRVLPMRSHRMHMSLRVAGVGRFDVSVVSVYWRNGDGGGKDIGELATSLVLGRNPGKSDPLSSQHAARARSRQRRPEIGREQHSMICPRSPSHFQPLPHRKQTTLRRKAPRTYSITQPCLQAKEVFVCVLVRRRLH